MRERERQRERLALPASGPAGLAQCMPAAQSYELCKHRLVDSPVHVVLDGEGEGVVDDVLD